MSSRFWWALRHYWHIPNFYRQSAGMVIMEETKQAITYYLEDRRSGDSRRKAFKNAFWYWRLRMRWQWRHLPRKLWWRFWWLQPLRCNGNAGGWRTNLCDWLENKARHEEELDDRARDLAKILSLNE